MKYFNHCKDLNELKTEFKKLAKKFHPDRGGDTATMQEINAQYAEALRVISNGMQFEAEEVKIAEDFQKIINELINLEGLIIDLVGNWIWVYGSTVEHKNTIKSLGLWWAKNKKKWYYRPANFKSSNRKPKSYEQITQKYGRKTVTNANSKATLNVKFS